MTTGPHTDAMLTVGEIDINGHIPLADPAPLDDAITRLPVEWDDDVAHLLDPLSGDVVEIIRPGVAA